MGWPLVWLIVASLTGGAVCGAGQEAVTLHWAWEVQGAGSCVSSGGTLLRCPVREGAPASMLLSVMVSPPRAVHVTSVSVPDGWPTLPATTGWGTVRAVYTFAPPPGGAGSEVEITFQAWAAGIPPLQLRLVLNVLPANPSCSVDPGLALGGDPGLPWSADRPIGWDDFWAPPPSDRDPGAAAAIATVLAYDLTAVAARDPGTGRWQARIASLTVTNEMERDRSWALPERRTAAALAHEQGHFDLAEVYRRILERELQGLSGDGWTAAEAEQALRTRAREAFQRVTARQSEVQARYDRETDHGRDAARQADWEGRIAAWLRNPDLAPQP
ncbi:DUF922 domain-containing protein [Candidatus Bipolaricaulota bacterium]|nr:DUF922 domain-containing protein [Candidatus Bipolaricaulota bacterium]